MNLPERQLRVLEAVCEVHSHVVVILSAGGVLTLPLYEDVPAILDGGLLGQAGGSATADLLFGRRSPSSRHTETVLYRLEDVPSYLHFPGDQGRVVYGEGLYVGYRGFNAQDMDVRLPFGHGLSYNTFAHESMKAEDNHTNLRVQVEVTNTGPREGREVVQVYVGTSDSPVARPPQELKGFTSLTIQPGETRVAVVNISHQSLAYWNINEQRWIIEGGTYDVKVGASSRDIRNNTQVLIEGNEATVPLTRKSTLSEALDHAAVGEDLRKRLLNSSRAESSSALFGAEGLMRMIFSFPLDRLPLFPKSGLSDSDVESIIARPQPVN